MKAKTKRRLKILLFLFLAPIVIYAAIALFPRLDNFPRSNPMMKEGNLPLLIAHGGGNREFPDNTLEAFYNAYSVDPRG